MHLLEYYFTGIDNIIDVKYKTGQYEQTRSVEYKCLRQKRQDGMFSTIRKIKIQSAQL